MLQINWNSDIRNWNNGHDGGYVGDDAGSHTIFECVANKQFANVNNILDILFWLHFLMSNLRLIPIFSFF